MSKSVKEQLSKFPRTKSFLDLLSLEQQLASLEEYYKEEAKRLNSFLTKEASNSNLRQLGMAWGIYVARGYINTCLERL